MGFMNMGAFDRVTRFALGGIIFAGGWYSGHWEMCIPSGIAAVTGFIGYCPFYAIFSFDSLDEPVEVKVAPPVMIGKREIA